MLGLKTIDSILKNFNKNITDLRSIAEAKQETISTLNTKIMDMKDNVNKADADKTKATNIANNLEKLISGN